MDDNPETTNMPLLAVGRQSYTLGSEDVEYPTSSSSHCPLGIGDTGTGNFNVMSGVEGGDYHHSSGSCNYDPWANINLEPSQMQPPLGSEALKRQSCMSLVPSQWDSQHDFSGTLDEGSSRSGFGVEQSMGQCSEPGLLRLSDEANHGILKQGFEFCYSGPSAQSERSNFHWTSDGLRHGGVASTRNTLQEEIQGDWRGFAELHSFGVRQGDARVRMAPCLEGYHSGSVRTNMPENEVSTNFSLEFQNTGSKHSGCADESLDMRANLDWNDASGAQGNLVSGALLSAQSSSLTGSGKREAPFLSGESTAMHSLTENTCARPVHSNTGRRFKRKSSTAGLTSSLSFRSPHSSARKESSSSRLISSAMLDRPDVANEICTATDISHTTNPVSVRRLWDNPHNPRGIAVGGENDNMPEFRRVNPERSLPFSGINEQCQRGNQTRCLIPQPEQSLSLLRTPFSRGPRRSMLNSQHHRWPRHIPSEEQPLESGSHSLSNSAATHESDQRSASVMSHRTTSHVLTGSWNSNPLMFTRNNHQTGAAAAQRVPNFYEAGHMRTESWLGNTAIDNHFISQTSSDPLNRTFTSSTTRDRNSLDQHSRLYHNGAGSLIRPGSTSRLHPSASAGHNRIVSPGTNIAIPPSASGSTFPMSGVMAAQFASINQRPSYSATWPHVLGGNHGEGILVSHIRSLLGMPFRGLHMLPGVEENRNRLFSQELVMLDPSIVFDSIDMIDQHRDMRLDVDDMSYEELLALEERIGNVCTGLSEEMIEKCLKRSKYVDLEVPTSAPSQESEVKCCICQEEYILNDELGTLECSHRYHVSCIKQWLVHKNQCPICKAAAYLKL